MKNKTLLKLIVLTLTSVLLSVSFSACANGNGGGKNANTQNEIFIVENNLIKEVTDYGKTLTELSVPSEINGVEILGVGISSFLGCNSLKTVTFAKTIKTIGQEAFRSCATLEKVTFENNSNLNLIDHRAFFACKSLNEFNFGRSNALKTIGQEAFRYCTGLKSIEFSARIESLGNNAFDGSGLEEIVIPPSVKKVGSSAFAACKSLVKVTFSKGIEELGAFAFYTCYNLTSINYLGTKAEWRNVLRGAEWRYQVPATDVICIDGPASRT